MKPDDRLRAVIRFFFAPAARLASRIMFRAITSSLDAVVLM
jgi:hypothetical protein